MISIDNYQVLSSMDIKRHLKGRKYNLIIY